MFPRFLRKLEDGRFCFSKPALSTTQPPLRKAVSTAFLKRSCRLPAPAVGALFSRHRHPEQSCSMCIYVPSPLIADPRLTKLLLLEYGDSPWPSILQPVYECVNAVKHNRAE